MKKVMIVFGTRPEAIKMCPLILQAFKIEPDYDLAIMKDGQTLFDVTANVLNGIKKVLEKEKPDIVLVHGDTTTTFATGLAAFYMDIPVEHVEAELRTYNLKEPFPEEFNRQGVGIFASYHFALPGRQGRIC